jgi:hypothetical protein
MMIMTAITRAILPILFMMFTIFLLPFVMFAMILILFIATAPRHAPPRRCPSVPEPHVHLPQEGTLSSLYPVSFAPGHFT